MNRLILAFSVFLSPSVTLAESISGVEVIVNGRDDSSRQLIQRKANAQLSTLRKVSPAWDADLPHHPIRIEVSIGEDAANGSSRYRVDDNGRPQDVHIELVGNINGIIKDALPRQLSQVVLAEQIGIPPRWAEMGIGLLAESRNSQNKNWRTFREFRDSGNLIPAAKLFACTQFPEEPEQLRVMFVQSMAVAEFIVSTWDRDTLAALASDAKRNGIQLAVRNQLGFDNVGEFDLAFRQWAAER